MRADARTATTVIFDLDTTLVLDMEHAHAAFVETARSVAPDDPTPLADRVVDAARDLWRASEHVAEGKRLGIASWEILWADFGKAHPCLDPMKAWAPDFRRRVWETALRQGGYEGVDPSEVAQRFVDLQRLPHPLVPGGIEALRAVSSAGRQVAILTNGPPDIQRHKLAQLQCDELLAAVVISGEVGVGKPDPAIFELTLARVGATATDAVMVGDSWNRDVEGACRSGLAAVWLSFGRPVPDASPGEVTVVDNSERLSEALGC